MCRRYSARFHPWPLFWGQRSAHVPRYLKYLEYYIKASEQAPARYLLGAWPAKLMAASLLVLLLAVRGAAAATPFSPDLHNCTKTEDSTARNAWWECSRALRAALYESGTAWCGAT